ncbi:hypothetical protein Vafri_13133 [Volvox africanus]|uniref:Uncharacterized protein n=1 Tax=Volvox africanus TaxID=51714 RepID=A0A8J4BB79_9CHLO|nr:hypothetical protein Vafri_13133 [Volvox africanus]
MEQQFQQLTPQNGDCQAVVFFHGRKVTNLPASSVVITVPATQQLSGLATGNVATSVSNTSPTRPDATTKPSTASRGANLTFTELAALTNSTRGDKLRDTRVWVAGLTMNPQPPGAPPATAPSTSETMTFTGPCPVFHHFPNQPSKNKQCIPHRRSDDNRLFKQHLTSTVGIAAGGGGGGGGGASCSMEPSDSRRGSHFSGGNDGSVVDTVSGSGGAVTSPVGGRQTRASSATTTSSFGPLDTHPCSSSGPWADFVVTTGAPLATSTTTTTVGTVAATTTAASGAAAAAAVATAAVAGIAAASGGNGTSASTAIVISAAAAGSGGSWTSGDNDEETAPLLSAYVAAMPSAGVAPPNEDIRIASKRQRSTGDSIWSASRQHHSHPHPHCPQFLAGSAAAVAVATVSSSPTPPPPPPPPPCQHRRPLAHQHYRQSHPRVASPSVAWPQLPQRRRRRRRRQRQWRWR